MMVMMMIVMMIKIIIEVKNDPSLSTGLVGIHWKLGVTTVDRRISSLSVKRSKEIVSLDLDPATNQLVSEMEAGTHYYTCNSYYY